VAGVIFVLVLALIGIGGYVGCWRYGSRAPTPNEALLHIDVPPEEAVRHAAAALEEVWGWRPVRPVASGLRVSVRISKWYEVWIVVREWNDGSALTVGCHDVVRGLFSYARNARNVRRVAEQLVAEGAELRYPL
jgi:hypothetical protein